MLYKTICNISITTVSLDTLSSFEEPLQTPCESQIARQVAPDEHVCDTRAQQRAQHRMSALMFRHVYLNLFMFYKYRFNSQAVGTRSPARIANTDARSACRLDITAVFRASTKSCPVLASTARPRKALTSPRRRSSCRCATTQSATTRSTTGSLLLQERLRRRGPDRHGHLSHRGYDATLHYCQAQVFAVGHSEARD